MEKKTKNQQHYRSAQARFGTFGGVFTPCVLTIFGVIMFMRTGFVVGYAGLWLSLLILLLSKLITTLTTLSLSAIATNLKMRGGGPYFMISRVLGPDFGGSIGITLYFAQAVGVAFYVIGFTEALFAIITPVVSHGGNFDFSIWISHYHVPQLVSSVVVGFLFLLTFKGADVAIRAQYVILVILLLGVFSYIIGGFVNFETGIFLQNQTSTFSSDIGFWTVFAIFFPATTGISAGVNLSGDLKKPAKSIPKGTLMAVAFTALIYFVQILLMSGSVSKDSLQTAPFESLQEISLWGPLIMLGVFAATLSSALGSFLGAPRILQAMGQDRLMKVLVLFGKGSGETNEPRRATVLTFVLAIGVIWAGDLNAVAEVISTFFLIAYGTINLSAFVESRGGNPSFRPLFRPFHWSAALAGAIGCVIVMLKINDTYAIIALGLTGLIYFYLKKRDIKTSYGDAKTGYIFKRTRDNLLLLEESKPHPKNWRPIVLAICEEPRNEMPLLRMGAWIEGNRGLYTVFQLIQATGESLPGKVRLRKDSRENIKRLVNSEDIHAFVGALVTEDISVGLSDLLQSYAFTGIKPNTVAVTMPTVNNKVFKKAFLKKIEVIATFDLNLVLLKPGDIAPVKRHRRIDLWWRGEKNGSLMALFAYLLTLDEAWSDAKIRLLRIASNNAEEVEGRRHMNALKKRIRIPSKVKIVKSTETAQNVIAATSGPVADLVLLGIRATSGETAKQSLAWLEPLLEKLPTTLLVWSNGEADAFE